MHIYQKHILDLLRTSLKLRYSELQPDGVESSHFKYHLNQLIQDGLVARLDRGVYGLTARGKMAVDRLSENRVNPQQTPKVITYTLLQKNDQYYLYRKRKEPFLDTLNMVAGKVHLGERVHDAALREVREKTNLEASDIKHALVAEVRVYESEVLISHFVAYVFVAGFEGESTKLESYTADALADRQDVAPDLLTLIEAVKTGQKFVALDCTFGRS